MLGISQQGYVVGCRAEWGKPIKTLWRLIPGVALAIAPLFNHLRKQKSSRDSSPCMRPDQPKFLAAMCRKEHTQSVRLGISMAHHHFLWVTSVSVQLQPGLRNCTHRK
jgi:hypothetical protein